MDEMVNELCEQLRTHQRVLRELQARGQRQDPAPMAQVERRIRQCEGWLTVLGADTRLADLRNGPAMNGPTLGGARPQSNAA